MDGYLYRMGHHFIVAVDERRAKIYDDVHDESDIDWKLKNASRVMRNITFAV